MRVALSLIDLWRAWGTDRLTLDAAADVLPPPLDESVAEVIDRVADSDAAGALGAVDRCLSRGQTIERFCEALIEYLRTLMLIRVCGSDTDLIDVSGGLRDSLAAQAERSDAATYVYMIGLVEQVRQAARWSSASRPLVDAAIVRLAMASNFSSLESVLARLEGQDAAEPTASAPKSGNATKPLTGTTGPRRGSATQAGDAPRPRRTGSSRGRTTASAAPAARNVARGQPSSEDREKVMSNPAVRRTMELFEGSTVVDVRRRGPGAVTPAPDGEGETQNGVDSPTE